MHKIGQIIKTKQKVNSIIYWSIRKALAFPCKKYLKLTNIFLKKETHVEERIIVSLTSWSKRINNVATTLDSILANTIKPDLIVLNLSYIDFPNGEKDLPDNLLDFSNKCNFEIIWHNDNKKAFKKIIPTMKKYPHDAIISIDDDFIYPHDMIETFVTTHKKFANDPLTANDVILKGVRAHCGCASLVKADYFGPYIDILMDDKVLEIGADDVFYTFCARLNNMKYRKVGKTFYTNMKPNNPIEALSDLHKNSGYIMTDYLIVKIKKIYHISFDSMQEPIFWL